MNTDQLQSELEQRFTLEELFTLTRDHLGLAPETIGGTVGLGSYVRALTQHCQERGELSALLDAALRLKPEPSSALGKVIHTGLAEAALERGDEIGEWTIEQRLGQGPTANCYLAADNTRTQSVRLKHFNATAAQDRTGLARYFAYARYLARRSGQSVAVGVHAGRPYVAQSWQEGQSLAARLESTRTMTFVEAAGVLRPLLLALDELHSAGLVHGNLKPENILVHSSDAGLDGVTLLDGGLHYLRFRDGNDGLVNLLSASNPQTIAPEVLTGHPVSVAADVYAVGAILFAMLTGSFPFAGSSPISLAVGHLTEEAPLLSELGSTSVAPEIDEFVQSLLAKQPEERPRSARKVLEQLETLQLRRSQRPPPPRADIEPLVLTLLDDPTNTQAALALEGLVEAGANAQEIAYAFRDAALKLDEQVPAQRTAKLGLYFRAARLLRAIPDKEAAESVYLTILELDPNDNVATTALEDVRLALGKHDALVEMWLTQHDSANDAATKSAALSKIGHLYERELNDPSQALVAYCQSYCTLPSAERAHAVERVAGGETTRWQEALQTCSEFTQEVSEPERRAAILLQLGEWYANRLHRLDLATQCYQASAQADTSNPRALDALAGVLRKAQQWSDLAELLTQRATLAPAPRNREYLVQAAQVYASKLNDKAKSRSILERVLEEDPLHGEALGALGDLYQEAGDLQAYARLLERRAEHGSEAERLDAQCRLANITDQQLGDPHRAAELYERILQRSPDHLEALQGLEALQERTGKYRELLTTLTRQLNSAVTPRQRVRVLARLASLHEQEFLDSGQAVACLEQLLTLDPKNVSAFVHLERLRREDQDWAALSELYEKHAAIVTDATSKASLLIERAKLLRSPLNQPDLAIAAFEEALKLAPEDPEALAGLAELRQASGDAEEALKAIQQLARNAPTPEAQADNYVRAAQLLSSRKDLAGAVEHYLLALEAMPSHPAAAAELRRTYVELGNAEKAINLLYDLVEPMPVGAERAKLTAELARLLYQHTDDWDVASETAEQALEWNDSSVDALFVLGAVAYGQERFNEAYAYLSRLLPYVGSLSHDDAVDSLLRYAETASRLGDSQSVLTATQQLATLAPSDLDGQRRLADLVFIHGQPSDALGIYKNLLDNFGSRLSATERAETTARYATCLAKSGQLDLAISLLEEACDFDPQALEPLRALADAYTSRGDYVEVWDIKQRILELLSGDARVDMLVELGEFAVQHLDDRDKATSYLVMALDERPQDRNLLTRLMQLYTEDKAWTRLVDVVLKLADFVTDDRHKAKYLMTAGMVTVRELQDKPTALGYFERVLTLDPTIEKALVEGLAIATELGELERAERLLKAYVQAASREQASERLRDGFVRLGALYKGQADRTKDAIEAYEAANAIDSSDKTVWHELSELYARDTQAHFEKARSLFTNILVEDPYRAEAYKALRKIYTDVKHADGAWCLCQALAVLKLAQPDEERFYRRMRSDDPAYAQSVLSHYDYNKLVVHESMDQLVSDVFAIIQPAVVASRGYEFYELGYDPNFAVDLSQHPHAIGQTLHYAAGVLGMEPPPAFDNVNDPGGLAFLDTKIPSISMGLGVLSAEIHPQALAFLAGRHLSYYRGGFFLRQLVGTGTGLKAWLFAAIKLISPAFPITPDIEGAVVEHLQVLRDSMPAHAKDDLARAVSKLLQSASTLDLRIWVNAVDYTADRVGFILAHDLETAVEVVRSTEDDEHLVRERVKQLVLYSISPSYLELRRHLKTDIAG